MTDVFPDPAPRVFALPPGVDFAAELAAGLRARMASRPPEAMARVTIYVNAGRMRRQLQAAFDAGPATLLPRIRLVTDLADPLTDAALPEAVPPLRRRLELTTLVARLLDAQPDLAPRAALFDLADSLAALLAEMQTEGVPPDRLEELDVSDQSGHWQRALRFLTIVQGFAADPERPDPAGRARLALAALTARWAAAPPTDPVIVAGSTGSRGTTHALMLAVARLPQGALVLPGFDFDMPQAVWDRLDTPLTGEDHPQYRHASLMRGLGLQADGVRRWTESAPAAPARNAVLSLALRPAPVTHQWMTEGPALPDLPGATAGVTLLEAPSPRDEALAIALRLRRAAEDGVPAALVSPDRMLTRQVTAALDRWRIRPDDSAGTPAQLSPPGRFLRHVAALSVRPLSTAAALALLKHPLTHTGADRNVHLLNTRNLELHLRAEGLAYPRAETLRAWGHETGCADWADWVAETLCGRDVGGVLPLADRVAAHRALADRIAQGATGTGAGVLWKGQAGGVVLALLDELQAEAAHGTALSAADYADLFGAILRGAEIPDRIVTHPGIRIWGTLELRAMGGGLIILAGLNEGSWPEAPAADPWLNRAMRAEAGLTLPDRQIGLSAHDFQQGVAAGEVWLSRAVKSDDAETVPSRWLNRIVNLMTGLPDRHGPEALAAMRARGADWLALARAVETPVPVPRATRPSPAPPALARPTGLSVTRITTLIRDPFAIYAEYVLRLRPLDPMVREPDALLRGTLMHEVLEDAVREARDTGRALTADALNAVAARVLGDPARLPSPATRILWQARIGRVADWFATTEEQRAARGSPVAFEHRGEVVLAGMGFTLRATPDRIDLTPGGRALIYDYKTGRVPTQPSQKAFDKQILLEAAMAERGAFDPPGAVGVAGGAFIGLSPSERKIVPAPLDEAPPDQVWEEFARLIAAYADPGKGYTARRAMLSDRDTGRYDHLARLGEWDLADDPVKVRVG